MPVVAGIEVSEVEVEVEQQTEETTHSDDPVGRVLAEVDTTRQSESDMLLDLQDLLLAEVEVAVASLVVSVRLVLAAAADG